MRLQKHYADACTSFWPKYVDPTILTDLIAEMSLDGISFISQTEVAHLPSSITMIGIFYDIDRLDQPCKNVASRYAARAIVKHYHAEMPELFLVLENDRAVASSVSPLEGLMLLQVLQASLKP